MDFFKNLETQYIVVILGGSLTIISVIIGVILTHNLNSYGKVKLIIKLFKIIPTKTVQDLNYEMKYLTVSFDEAFTIKLKIILEILNSSGTTKSVSDFQLLNNKGFSKPVSGLSHIKINPNEIRTRDLKILSIKQNEIENIECVMFVDKDFFINKEKTKIYLKYKLGKSIKKVLLS